MPLMHMNWKTGRMEPCIDPELKRGQLVVGFDGPASQHDGVVLARQESARWGTSYQILWMDDLRTSGHQVIRPIAERFGIGVYFHPGKFMPEAEIVKLEQRFQEKEKIEAEEAEKLSGFSHGSNHRSRIFQTHAQPFLRNAQGRAQRRDSGNPEALARPGHLGTSRKLYRGSRLLSGGKQVLRLGHRKNSALQ